MIIDGKKDFQTRTCYNFPRILLILRGEELSESTIRNGKIIQWFVY